MRIALQAYNPAMENLGVTSPWMEPLFENFRIFFASRDFGMLLGNTLVLSLLGLLLFPMPIIVALMLNELRSQKYKRVTQSVLYLPHFISWVVFHSIVIMLLGPAPNGLINNLLQSRGIGAIPFLESNTWFRFMYVIENSWKETGWGTIIYLAALSGVDEQLYEAAVMDGAGRFRQLVNITIPCIMPTVVVMLILRFGSFLDSNFDQVYLMLNSLTRSVASVFDTYIYDVGVLALFKPQPGISNYSYSAAIGIFRSVIGLLLVTSANAFAKLVGEEGIY